MTATPPASAIPTAAPIAGTRASLAVSDTRRSRPRLNPSTRVLWRTANSIQLELGRRSLVVDGVDAQDVRELLGTGEPRDDDLLDSAVAALTDAGFLWQEVGSIAPSTPRLAAELAALRIRHGRRAIDVLDARREAFVSITGGGRVAAALGSLLAAAGVGHVHIAGTGQVQLRTTMPAGFAVADEGRDVEQAAADALRRAAPEVQTNAPTRTEPADLIVITGDGPVEENVHQLLHTDAQAHLVVRCAGDHLVVGPLVLPGLTSCLRCADLHRVERDPAWSALVVQLAATSKYPPASDVALAGLAASIAAMHALAFLDGDEPASVNATIELELPDWQLHRRPWPARPDCPCATATAQ